MTTRAARRKRNPFRIAAKEMVDQVDKCVFFDRCDCTKVAEKLLRRLVKGLSQDSGPKP